MVTTEELELVRHIVHKILIPCIFAVGVVGNTLSIIVLTRKRMRCSTNVYLTGLAITDLLYLAMCFIMSLKHYKGMHSYKMYWSLMGLFHWLIDSFSYISICIVVSFTIERYIAVCHPIRGQSMCTEARAKKVIGIITVVVMLSILSTAFEYQLHHEKQPVDKVTGELCTIVNATEKNVERSHRGDGFFKPESVLKKKHRRDSGALRMEPIPFSGRRKKDVSGDYEKLGGGNESTCVLVDYYIYESSDLGKNPHYSIFYITTSIVYAGIPLILLVTFNTFLIMAVRKSNKLRKEMTNNMNSRQVKQKISSMTQENKITITLIAVVILFVVCQLPWACISIAENFTEFDDNFEKLISNIANLLVAINAAANFFLYCLLSDKYRRTVKELITGHHYRRQDTLSNSFSRQTTLGSSWYKHSWRDRSLNDSQRTQGSTATAGDDRETTVKFSNSDRTGSTRKQSTIPEENEHQNLDEKREPSTNNHPKLSTFTNELANRRASRNNEGTPPSPSFGPLDCGRVNYNRKESPTTVLADDTTPEKPCEPYLKPSSSSHSLPRSHSLDATPKIRHSPDCKDFPYNL